MLRFLVMLAALGAVALTACGEESPPAAEEHSSSPSSSPSGPACEEIWVDGATLPADYAGCYDAGTLVEVETLPCASGQKVVLYADRFYAVPGKQVNDEGSLQDSAAFTRITEQCGA